MNENEGANLVECAKEICVKHNEWEQEEAQGSFISNGERITKVAAIILNYFPAPQVPNKKPVPLLSFGQVNRILEDKNLDVRETKKK